jgi:hypothetical protein
MSLSLQGLFRLIFKPLGPPVHPCCEIGHGLAIPDTTRPPIDTRRALRPRWSPGFSRKRRSSIREPNRPTKCPYQQTKCISTI